MPPLIVTIDAPHCRCQGEFGGPMRGARQPTFRSRGEVERHYGGKTIKCLLCGRRFRRLAFHLAAKHRISTDKYKARFGLPWSRGLISAQSLANSGWSKGRRAKASELARRCKFFRFATVAPRRELAPFLRAEALKNLQANSVGFGKKFELRVRTLFHRGCTDANIADALHVNRMTVNSAHQNSGAS